MPVNLTPPAPPARPAPPEPERSTLTPKRPITIKHNPYYDPDCGCSDCERQRGPVERVIERQPIIIEREPRTEPVPVAQPPVRETIIIERTPDGPQSPRDVTRPEKERAVDYPTASTGTRDTQAQRIPADPTHAQPGRPEQFDKPKPEVPTAQPPAGVPAVPTKPEEKSSARKKNPPAVEEKASAPEPSEETTSGSKKRKFNGKGGRIHTEAQIDEILDFYLMTGELPIYVSDRQRYDYRHHQRLPEREELLVKRGLPIDRGVSGTAGYPENVVSLSGTNVQRKSGTS